METPDVFFSRPNHVDPRQTQFIDALIERMQRAGLRPRTVGVDTFDNSAPLLTVARLMQQCRGAVILGLRQTWVATGELRARTRRREAVNDIWLATPWNQLEAGAAFALRLPLLVILEEGVLAEGIFDSGVSDRFIHRTRMRLEWLDSEPFRQPFSAWVDEVTAFVAGSDGLGTLP